MEYITLRNSQLQVSRLCIGGDPMGGHAWGVTDENELIEAVHTGIDAGINFFDTADVYGLGTAERILAKALGTHRQDVVIATKFGVRRTEDNTKTYYDNSPQWIRQAVEGSLKRLCTDYIDIYQIHYRDGVTPVAEVVEELERLKQRGLIRYYGLSNVYERDVEELLPFKGKFVSFQNEYSLACRSHEKDMQKLVSLLDVTPLTWGSLGQGILTGKYGRDVRFDASDRRSRATYKNFHGEKLQKNIDIVDVMRSISPEYEKPLSAIAIRFILDHLTDSAVLVGVKRKEQVLSNVEACGWKLSAEHLNMLRSISEE